MWKQAIKYADLVFQFALSIALSFLLAHYLGQWLGMKWLPIVVLFLMAPLSFYRLWIQLERQSADD